MNSPNTQGEWTQAAQHSPKTNPLMCRQVGGGRMALRIRSECECDATQLMRVVHDEDHDRW